jgi:deoxyribodipyrimidine photolyase
VTQSRKFDAQGNFIRRCLLGHDYPQPIVDHDEARKRTLARFSVVKNQAR